MTELTGTPKQVEWAKSIQHGKLEALDFMFAAAEGRPRDPGLPTPQGVTKAEVDGLKRVSGTEMWPNMIAAADSIRQQVSAAWWIDNKEKSAALLLKAELQTILAK